MIDPLAEAPTACWYVRPQAGGQYGPATAEVMRQWLTENRVAASSLVWREGWATWRSAQEVFPQLASQVAGAGPGAGAGPVAGAAAPAARTPVQPSYLSSAQAFSDPSADADLSMPRPDDAAQNLYQRRREMARRRMTVVAILLVVSILLIVGLCVVVFWR